RLRYDADAVRPRRGAGGPRVDRRSEVPAVVDRAARARDRLADAPGPGRAAGRDPARRPRGRRPRAARVGALGLGQTRRIGMKKLLYAIVLASFTAGASAQGYPSKPLRLIIPYAPGGVGGFIGVEATAKSAPDGYTPVIMDPAIVINPVLQDSVPYDVIRDLTAVSIV